jgi:hypothetical protein
MQVVYLNGTRLHLTWREMQSQFQHPLFVGLLLGLVSSIVVIGPYDRLLNFDALKLAVFYACAFGSFVALLFLAMYTCHRRNWAAYSVLTVGPSGTGCTLAGLGAALLLGAPVPALSDILMVAGFNLVICFLGDIIHATYVMPRVMADLRGVPRRDVLVDFIASESGRIGGMDVPAPVAPERVTLCGQSFALHALRLIEAEEHYVAITLDTGARALLRGRIADAVAALPPDLGRRVHRSFWVATVAVDGFRQTKTGAQVILTDGRCIPVARGRIAMLRDWAEQAPMVANKKAPRGVPL